MAVIHIDGKQVEVNGADNLLEACLSLGIDVPYFCYHPALGSVGSCRQCAVKQSENAEDAAAGKGRLVMSCMVAPTDGMYISVDDDEAKAFRQSIVEFLMTNHPHDCPTCEEGGNCHLQDMTYMSGHNIRRYRFTKRTHHNQDLGPFIGHEMNRCIACYRCVRFYKDYAGGDDLGVYASNNRVYFGRDKNGQFQSEFSGNLTEVCPTGVFTDKSHSERYNRKWDMQYAPSVCHGCSAGCNISPGERYGELRRIENRYNSEVNQYFLCDLGRFSYGYVNRKDRPVQPLEHINDKHVKINLNYAIDETVKRIKGKKLIGIGSPRASLETNFALKKLVGFENFSTGLNSHQQLLVEKCIEILSTEDIYNPSISEIEEYDAIFILGEDITQTSSRVALAVRQAAKNKAKKMANTLKTQNWLAEPVMRIGQNEYSPVYIADVVQTKLDDISKVSCVASPDDIVALGFEVADSISDLPNNIDDIKTLANRLVDDTDKGNTDKDAMQLLAKQIACDLVCADKPLVISGTGLFRKSILEASAQVSQVLTQKRRDVKAYELEKIKIHNAKVRAQSVDKQPSQDKELDAKTPKNNNQDDLARDPENAKENLELKEPNKNYSDQTGLYLTVPKANSIGVCLLGGRPVEELLAQDFDAVVIAENMLSTNLDVDKLADLLSVKTVITLDYLNLHWHKFVDLILPAASFAESDGTLVSAEGRAQRFFQVYDPNYYNPKSCIKESWRWLHAIETSLNGMPLDWTQLDDLINELIKTHPHLHSIKQVAPSSDYRISGLKVARQPRRYSGRTAMRADISVHEPMQPKDVDTALTFSMEGYTGLQTEGSMIPFAWAPGWNSPQAWNKYQSKVGENLKQGDPGIRLFDFADSQSDERNINISAKPKSQGIKQIKKREYVRPEASPPLKTSIFQGRAKLVPVYNLFASSDLAQQSPLIHSQLPEATFFVGKDDADYWHLSDNDWLAVTIDGIKSELPVKVINYLAEGCIGYPVGQVPVVHGHKPASVMKIDPPLCYLPVTNFDKAVDSHNNIDQGGEYAN